MKKTFILIIFISLILTMFGCDNSKVSLKDLPNGYEIICSIDGNKYSLKSNDFGGGMSANVFDTKNDAIEHAIRWNSIKNEPFILPSKEYEWEECK